MNLRNVDSRKSSGGHQNLLNVEGGHGFINMMSADNVVTRKKDYHPSQPSLGKDPTPPKKHFHIDKPEDIPRIPKGVLNGWGQNPNSRSTQHYSIVKDLG